MKAILLAGGYGTRLRPLTDTIPKCLVPIQGRPLLDIWLENLNRAGIGPCLVNTHYKADQVQAYAAASRWRDAIRLVHEPELLGTAGTLRATRAFWQDEQDVMVIHADNFCRCDLKAFMQAHHSRPTDCMMTMMLFSTPRPTECGIVELDGAGVVQRFHEKVTNPPGNLANAAVYIMSSALLKTLATQTDISTELLPSLLGRIYTWKNDDMLVDIGTPEAYMQLQQYLNREASACNS